MVKLKKVFILLFLGVFCFNFAFFLTGCSKNELDKVSKGLTSYSISASLEEGYLIRAKEVVEYVNNSEVDMSELRFHLYPRAFRKDASFKPYTTLTMASCFPNGLSYADMQIESVAVDGENKTFEIVGEDEDILKIEFGKTLAQGKKISIEMNFTETIPNCTHRYGYFDGNINLGNWYPIACEFDGENFDMTPYYSTGDPFFSSVSNYEVELTYPAEFKLASTGTISTEQVGEKLKSKMSAKAVRDFAMCLSNDSVIVSTKTGDVTVFYMGYENDADLAENLAISAEAISYFGKTFGTYPYEVLTVCKTPFIYGGMEYPNIVFISDAIDTEEEMKKVIVHEIAHQWWYGIVGNNETSEAWLDESLAEYSVALFFENSPKYKIDYDEVVSSALSSYLLYVDVISTIRGEVNTKMNLKVNEYQNDYEYSYMVYVKGVIMFDELKKAVGESKLISGLKKYYSNAKFKNASAEDFFASFEEACHKDLRGFFNSYLNGDVIISSIN